MKKLFNKVIRYKIKLIAASIGSVTTAQEPMFDVASYAQLELQKRMPYRSLPVTLLGRLARDVKFKGQGLGDLLLADAYAVV
jgi:hypothetical protein